MDWIFDPQSWIAFSTLLALEVVLGIDNVVFISILAGKLPAAQQQRARPIGLGLPRSPPTTPIYARRTLTSRSEMRQPLGFAGRTGPRGLVAVLGDVSSFEEKS